MNNNFWLNDSIQKLGEAEENQQNERGRSKMRRTPIFVVGVHRSGTTWLANILCRHSNIAGIQAERHFGIHESVFFSHFIHNFGDLRNDNIFIQFVEAFASSDHFILRACLKRYFL